ncbi:hypothetical protein B2G71_23025 [Novosphingobium sp. PC22D]|nr:hypothetical protein B2G71_23025 [Novosphingobium sp. PC22D]
MHITGDDLKLGRLAPDCRSDVLFDQKPSDLVGDAFISVRIAIGTYNFETMLSQNRICTAGAVAAVEVGVLEHGPALNMAVCDPHNGFCRISSRAARSQHPIVAWHAERILFEKVLKP